MTAQSKAKQDVALDIIDRIWNNGELEAIEELLAEDYVEHNPSQPADVEGYDEYREYVQSIHSSYEGFTKSIEDVIVGESKVVLQYTIRGTVTDELMGLDPTHEEIEFEAIYIFEIEGDRAVEGWEIADSYGMAEQLGATITN